jgi:exopolysaccharide biosynthesis WecB/TagA/CpsF family protein
MIETVEVLGIPLHNLSKDELLQRLDRGIVFNPNVDVIMKLRKDPELRQLFREAEYCVCDSRIVEFGARFLGTPLKGRVPGSRFLGEFCSYHQNNKGMRLFLLGAGPGVADLAGRRINERLGREIVVGSYSPPFGFETDPAENLRIIALIKASGATVLAVGVGCPKQERWIMRHRHELPGIRVFLAVGATLDFEAGRVARAPDWVNALGMEWAYRLAREPRRLWRRYLVEDSPFLFLLLAQKLGIRFLVKMKTQ